MENPNSGTKPTTHQKDLAKLPRALAPFGQVDASLTRRYQGTGLDGEVIEREVEGFHARVVQHECDHLDGILYPQRMTDHRLLVFLEELQRHPIDLAGFLTEK